MSTASSGNQQQAEGLNLWQLCLWEHLMNALHSCCCACRTTSNLKCTANVTFTTTTSVELLLLLCLAGQQAIGQLRWLSMSAVSSGNQQQAEGPNSGSSAFGNL
jgi:hypothetical protein